VVEFWWSCRATGVATTLKTEGRSVDKASTTRRRENIAKMVKSVCLNECGYL
jgi:hypothetical protein